MPVPFNLTSLRKAFGPEEGKRLGEKLIAAYGAEKKVTILELRQNQDPELAKVADYVYEHVFVHYTMKQWGQTPDQIDPNTTARVPVFLSEDDRYFQDEYQGMPLKGYTPLFEAMLDHPNITVRLGEDAIPRLGLDGDVLTVDGVPFQGPVVYTGAADQAMMCGQALLVRSGGSVIRVMNGQMATIRRDGASCLLVYGQKVIELTGRGVMTCDVNGENATTIANGSFEAASIANGVLYLGGADGYTQSVSL